MVKVNQKKTNKGGTDVSLSLKVYFDFTCPYCYLAWGYMKKLKESMDIDDHWVTWEIHPTLPKEGAHIQKVVPTVNMAERKGKLNGLGAPVGLTPGDREILPYTHLALQGAEYAIDQGKMHAWIDAVYHASFVTGKNIGDQEALLAIARQVGLDAGELAARLEQGYYKQRLLDHDAECAAIKLEWVPTVYAGDVRIIEGAFTYDQFAAAVQGLAKR